MPQVVLYETGGEHEYISPNVAALLGYPAERFTADKTFFPGLIHPDDASGLAAIVSLWREAGARVLTMEFRARRSDGDYVWLADYLPEMRTLARAIDGAYQRRKESIRTPQYVVDLTQTFRQTVLDAEGPDALGKCTAITEAIVEVGGNQDELVGESRQAVKVLRQRAGLAMATDPRTSRPAPGRTRRGFRRSARGS